MAKKTTTTEKSTKSKKKTTVEEQVTPVQEKTAKTTAAETVVDKLEDAVSDLVDEAKDDKHAWYAKIGLYIIASILGILTYLITNFGDTIYIILEKWFNSLAK